MMEDICRGPDGSGLVDREFVASSLLSWEVLFQVGDGDESDDDTQVQERND